MSTASTPARSRRPWLLTGVVLLLLVAAGVAIYLVWFRPKPTPEPDLTGAMAANLRGVALVEQLKYEDAQREFEQAIRLAPDWTPAQVNLGISLLNQQPNDPTKVVAPSVERAQQVLRDVLAREPDNKHAHYCLGVIAQYFNRLPEAYEHFAAVNRLDPEDAQTWMRLGACHPGGPDGDEARVCYEKALRFDPYLNEARYRLFQAVQRTDPAQTKDILREFERLREADWETPSRLEKYSEQGKYAEVIGRDPAVAGKLPAGPLPVFEAPTGFQVTLAPGADWAKAADLDPLRKAARERFGGAVVLFDYNGDGRPDVFLPSAVVEGGKVRDLLLRNDGGHKFTDVTAAAGLSVPRPSLGAAAADYDNDGLTDLVVTGAGEQHLFRNKGDGTFEDMSAAAGLDQVKGVCVGCGWADLDQDCDLDLVLCRYAESPEAAGTLAGTPAGGGVLLLENVGEARARATGGAPPPLTTRFKPNAGLANAAGPCAAVAVVIADLDGDHDPDVLVLPDRADPVYLENDRILRFRRATPGWAAGKPHPWTGGMVFFATHADRPDLLLTRSDGPPLYLTARGRDDFAPGNTNAPAARQAAAVDLDLDGWPDAVGLGAAGQPTLLHNQGEGVLEHKPAAFGLADTMPRSWGLVCADLDGDGAPDLLLWSDTGLTLRRSLGNENKALLIDPTGRKDPSRFMRTNAAGVGCRVMAQTGPHWTAAERATATAGPGQSFLPLSLGLGKHGQADVVRLRWPDGIYQAELALAANSVIRVEENSRKSTSCPVLVTWDGERYVFVTDFLGAGSMGELGPDGATRPPRPEESVKIEANQLRAKDGRFLLKVTEPMDEVLYLDHFRLDVLDHPAGTSVFPDERFATADPQPTQELLAFRSRIAPRRATDHRGADVTKLVLDRDRRAVDGFHLRSWLGFAEDHALTLDFGDVPAGAKRWVLVLAGWTEYPYPESIYAAERAGVPLNFPVLERLGADGKTWEALGDLGFPAGLPRVMTRPLPDLKPGPCVLRIRTNMQVYWDQAYLAPAEDVGLKVHSLPVERADLATRGFIQEVYPDGRPPVAYDDARTEQVPVTRWEGNLTRTGDVTELLTAADDRFVICGPGDEVAIRFDGSKLPELPAGWERSFVLRSRGYSKDAAPFTATGGKVGPLPFRAMKNYPDFGGVAPPTTDAARWHTRPAGGPAQPRRDGR